MSDEKEAERLHRKKRRGQQSREKTARRSTLTRAAHLDSKAQDEKGKLDMRIGKLIEQGYSPESVAKRLGVTPRRINLALDAIRRA
jgi:IS30 family transposase